MTQRPSWWERDVVDEHVRRLVRIQVPSIREPVRIGLARLPESDARLRGNPIGLPLGFRVAVLLAALGAHAGLNRDGVPQGS